MMQETRMKEVMYAVMKHQSEKGNRHLGSASVTTDEIDIVCSRGFITRGGRVTLKGHALLQSKK